MLSLDNLVKQISTQPIGVVYENFWSNIPNESCLIHDLKTKQAINLRS